MRQVRVYTASKLHHAALWRGLRETNPGIYFTARWPFFAGAVSDSSDAAEYFWQDDLADVLRSDVVLVYALSGEKLRGALVEVGAALSLGRVVYVVGKHEDYGTWQYHPNVVRVGTLDKALEELVTLRASIIGRSGCP